MSTFQQSRSPTPFDSDSISAFFQPWGRRRRPPPVYPHAQTGRTVTFTEFLLFFAAATLLIVAMFLAILSACCLYHIFRYIPLVFYRSKLPFFTVPALVLMLICSFLAFAVHNSKTTHPFLKLLMGLLLISVGLVALATYFGFADKLPVEEVRESLQNSLKFYKAKQPVRDKWHALQQNLACCGIGDFSDWLAVLKRVPASCCPNTRSCAKIQTTGCLQVLTSSLEWQSRMFNRLCCVALFLQCGTFAIIAAVYWREKWKGKK